MIIFQDLTLNHTAFQKVYSDTNYVLKRDDGEEIWEDLIVPKTHTYTETDRKISPHPGDEATEALKILFGEA